MPKRETSKVERVFGRVRAFVGGKFPDLRRVQLELDCDVIADLRAQGHLDGSRAFFHVGHLPNTICTLESASKKLSEEYLVALILHEFGHIATRAGDVRADQWVFRHFGIPIIYTGPMVLEWVSKKAILERGI